MQRARRLLATFNVHHQRPALIKRDASLPRQIWLSVPLQPNSDTTSTRRAVKSGTAILSSSKRRWSPYEPLFFPPSYSTGPASAADVTNGGADAEIHEAGPMAEYRRLIAHGDLSTGDENQKCALSALQSLYSVLIGSPDIRERRQTGGRLFSRWLYKPTEATIRGLYLYGGVGTGKTMLMDLFFHQLPSWVPRKRIHFHDFMLSVHAGLQKHRAARDPLDAVAEEIREQVAVLCLDEFAVNDVADAAILNRLFASLFAKGLVLVSTSNRAPDALYENGLQRQIFLPFIALLKKRCVVHPIDSPIDYRRLTALQRGLYLTGPDASALLQECVKGLTAGAPLQPLTVAVLMGRHLQIPLAAGGVAVCHFHELCEVALGAADYIAVFERFHTLALNGIPCFGASNISAAYRFVTLIDVMYEHHARLVCSAEGSPSELFERVRSVADAPKKTSSRSSRSEDADVAVDDHLGFVKERTVSR